EVQPLWVHDPRDVPVEEVGLGAARLTREERALLRRYDIRSGRLTVAWFRSRATATWKHRHELTATYLPELLPPGTMPARLSAGIDAHGYFPQFVGGITQEQRAKLSPARVQYYRAVGDFRLAPGPARAQTDLMKLCHDRAIPVTLFVSAEATTYRPLYGHGVREGVDAFLAEARG